VKLKQLLDSSGEKITYRIIETTLRDSNYRVFTKVRLGDLLQAEVDELSYEEGRFLLMSHFDFVVCEGKKDSFTPLFAIEFDGPQHKFDEAQRKRDILKNRLCLIVLLPLLRITYAELNKFENVTILQYVLKLFLDWRVMLRTGTWQERFDVESGYIFMDPFPAIFQVSRRLSKKFNIITQFTGKDEALRILQASPYVLHCCTIGKEMQPDGPQRGWYHKTKMQVFKKTLALEKIRELYEELSNPGDNVVYEATGEAEMKWLYPTQENEDQPPFHYIDGGIPGVDIPEVVRNLAEYRCLVNIEKNAPFILNRVIETKPNQ